MEDYDISETAKQGFHTVRCCSSLGMLFIRIGCFSWAFKSLNNRSSSSKINILLVDESLVSDS